jgi:hypothetical protein
MTVDAVKLFKHRLVELGVVKYCGYCLSTGRLHANDGTARRVDCHHCHGVGVTKE